MRKPAAEKTMHLRPPLLLLSPTWYRFFDRPLTSERNSGWRLAFDPEDMVQSQKAMRGSYWDEWLVSKCPALVAHGRDSRVTTQEEIEAMVSRRPNTTHIDLDGGHVVHQDSPAPFAQSLRGFLLTL